MDAVTITNRIFVALSLMVLCAAGAIARQDPGTAGPARGAGGRGMGPAPINAYAYADCGPGNAPAVHLVIVTGAVPATIPASTPQPSVKLVLNTSAASLLTQQSITVSADAAKGGPNALALSCPVVGDCVPAQSGTISIQRRAEDAALTGNYNATWQGTPARTGRFTAVWRESQKTCR